MLKIFNTKKIIIDDIIQNNPLTKFLPHNCNIKLFLSGFEINCYDHMIICCIPKLKYIPSELLLEPINIEEDFGVDLFFENSTKNKKYVIDKTIGKILCEYQYLCGMIGIKINEYCDKNDVYNEDNNILKIINKLENNNILDNDEIKLTIQCLEKYFNENH